jgi:hypothetical protein
MFYAHKTGIGDPTRNVILNKRSAVKDLANRNVLQTRSFTRLPAHSG